MPKLSYYLLLLLLLLTTATRAQNRKTDSLTATLRYNSRSDMGRTRPVIVPSHRVPNPRPAHTLRQADSALVAAHRRGDRQGEVDAHRKLAGYYLWEKGQLVPALQHMHQAQTLLAPLGDSTQLAWLVRLEGLFYMQQAKYEQAVEALRRAVALAPAGAPGVRGNTLSYLSHVYATLGNEPEAARYERLSAAYLPRMRTDSVAFDTCFMTLSMLGEGSAQREHWAASERYQRQALARARYVRPSEVIEANTSLATLYTLQNKPLQALRCLRPYVAAAVSGQLSSTNSPIRLALAAAYYENHQLDSANLHGQVALALARQTRSKASAYWAYRVMAAVAAEQHHYARAWEYQRLSMAYQDSLHIEESGYRMAFTQHNATVARQQARIALLTKDQELARLRQQRTAIGLALLAVLLAGSGGVAAYVGRQRQRRREAALRQRLAADLHDEVGSLLTRLSLESSLLSEGLRPPHEQQRQLAALVSVSQQALRQMRDVVWSIRPDHDTLPHLLDQLREHGYDLLTAAGLEFDFHAAEGVAQADLPAPARQHLYLIYKEALHNAVKHAQGASALLVRLTLEGSALQLTVRDDGAGTASPGRPSGLGLTSMRQRAESVGGTVAYETAPGQGFTVEVRLPLAGQHLRAMPTSEVPTAPQAPGLDWLVAAVD